MSELGGLRTDEVNADDVVPNLVIKDNDFRAEDGSDGGEKNEKRGRMTPLHGKLLRLGLTDHVQAIRDEGHYALVPELYLNDARGGGHQFRNIAWCHMMAWIALHKEVPVRPTSGKAVDMHSIRALGSSLYAKANASDLMRADVMGHARIGTNAIHYPKRMESDGMDQALAEYRAFMSDHIELFTRYLDAYPVRSLPLPHRSRAGKPRT